MAIVLSIIVPVYNVQKYLPKCINSLLMQDLAKDEYEIILVDDGSTDGSGSLCDEYASRQDNIRVIHQTNQGLSAARNSGMKIAVGKFIQYVDSDDYLEENVLHTLINTIEGNCLDVLRFNYDNVNEQDEVIQIYKNPKLFSDYSDMVTDGESFLLHRLGFGCYAWQFIILRELSVQIPFALGIHFEDTDWVIRLLPIAKKVSSTSLVAYHYRVREGSITKTNEKEKIRKNIKDQIRLIELFKKKGMSLQCPSWYDSMTSIAVISILDVISTVLYADRRPIISTLTNIGVFPISNYNQTKQAKRKIRIINLSPLFYCFLKHRYF